MADVRALLRQHREARRIEHPHAAYSDAGKLLCTLCREHIKVESLWDGHLRGVGHRQRLQQRKASEPGRDGDGGIQQNSLNGTLKRKLDDDVEMGDADDQTASHEETMRKKRSKPDMTLGELSPTRKRDERPSPNHNHKPITPPLTRRQSGTPTLGVEMQIPSRPATPGPMPQSAGSSAGGSASTVTTPKTAAPFARSPLIPHDPSQLPPPKPIPASAPSIQSQTAPSSTGISTTTVAVNEDEWAAFEADLIHGTSATSTKKPVLDSSAIISAPALTADEIAAAAKSEEEERAKRRAAADIQIEDEREEATRALETEFEVMEELEARAKKLRERREALRVRNASGGDAAAAAAAAILSKQGSTNDSPESSGSSSKPAVAPGKENAPGEEDEDEEDEDDEADDWVGFRFRS